MSVADERKREQRVRWDQVAPGWDRWFDWYSRNSQPLSTWCCDAAALVPGDRVLDVGCGSGQPALSAAARVLPHGSVAAIDISPEMLQVAERRAKALGLDHVTFREMDAEELAFADGSFDAATCACGLMFCPDPVRAAAEIRRVLRPGGRFAIAVWDHPSQNAFFSVAGRAIAQTAQLPRPAPDALTAFRLAPPGELERVLRAGGFPEIAIESCAMTFECASVDEYLEISRDSGAGLDSQLAQLTAQQHARFQAMVREGARPYLVGERLRLPATALCASGRA